MSELVNNLQWIFELFGLTELSENNHLFFFGKNKDESDKQYCQIKSSGDLITLINKFNGNYRITVSLDEFPNNSEHNADNASKINNILLDIDFNNQLRTEDERKEIFEKTIGLMDLYFKEAEMYPYYQYSGNKGIHALIPIHLSLENKDKDEIEDIIERFREVIIQQFFSNDTSKKYNIKIDDVNPFTAYSPIPYTIHPETNNEVKPLPKSIGYSHLYSEMYN